MRIAVNTRLLIKDRLEGLGRFSYETLKLITNAHPEHQFFFLFDRPFDHEFVFSDNVTPIVVYPPARHPILWHVWFEISLPNVLKKINPDVFLSPDGFLSLKADVVSLPVIHDLNFVHNPSDLARSHAWFYNQYFPKYASKAARIATVSEFSKQDIVTQYGVDSSNIDVVYNGVSERFKPLTEAQKQLVRAKWTAKKQYFIYVGAIHQRKNIERMLLAYDHFRTRTEEPHQFVLVGNKKWWTSSMQNALDSMKFKDEVIFTGRVSDNDLNNLMGAALANVYVSTFEGFGIPIIEAFQSGIPVITANVTSMPEIAADAALIVNPYEPSQIAEAMIRIASSTQLRKELVLKGQERASFFTWKQSADLLWRSVLKTVEG
ncbi:MAG: glycosyltransferase family 4 protein [Flavobacteriales bacterium]|nr:glycosyltransferase family 4 protein [Flavobacteriales bacterium]